MRSCAKSVRCGIAGNAPMHPITDKVRQVDYHGHFTAACGHAIYTARNYPKEYWNKIAFICEPTGHLVAAFLSETPPSFPYLGLVVSGGHTSLYAARGFGDYALLGHTRDDAAGEAFDKGAKLLGLPYPGGVAIDRLAKEGDARAIRFPKAIVKGADLDFSFSGLKTALLHHVKKHGVPEGKALADLCASYQEAIVRALVEKAFRAARRLQFERLVLSGGVAANSRLRAAVSEKAAEYEGMQVFLPAPRLCTDNAAMIAVAGTHALLRGERAGPDLNADPAWRL